MAKERLEKEAVSNNYKDQPSDEIKFDFNLSENENIKDVFDKHK